MLRADPQPDIPPVELFGGVSDEVWRWLHLEARDQCPYLRDYLPGLPDDPEFERQWVGSAGKQMLSQGFEIYATFKNRYERYAGPLRPDTRALDFGCGFGRVTRFFAREVGPRCMFGVDLSAQALAQYEDRWVRTARCATFPPLRFPNASLGLIYAFSVFSHLSEDVHEAWLAEFKRLLAPNGVLILTTFLRSFLEHDEQMRQCFDPVAEALAAYDAGGYVHRPLHDHSPHFGSTFIPEPYTERWPFRVREFFAVGEWGQNVIVCTH